MRIGLMVEGQNGLNWQRWQHVLQAAEKGGFDSVFRSDHFTNPQPPDKDSLELWASLTYAAATTDRIQFGPLVSPVTFRLPAITIKDAAAVENLSHGRLVLGLGIGWQVREHHDWGIPFPPVATRYEMLREYLTVTRRMFHSHEPVNFEGKHYQFHDALLLPRPSRPGGPPLLVGGNGERRTLPLAAELADEWNGVFITPEQFSHLSQRLDVLLDEASRPRDALRRSVMAGSIFARSQQELQTMVAARNDTVEGLQSQGMVVGTADMWIEQLRRYEQAGVQRIMVQWLDLDDIEGIETVAREVLPAFHG